MMFQPGQALGAQRPLLGPGLASQGAAVRPALSLGPSTWLGRANAACSVERIT